MNFVLMLLLAFAGGNQGVSPQKPTQQTDTRAQYVQSGDQAMWYVGSLHMTLSPVSYAEPAFDFALDKARTATGSTVDATFLDAEWHDQAGTTHKVHTVQGVNEKTKDFVERHSETVKALQALFPPVP